MDLVLKYIDFLNSYLISIIITVICFESTHLLICIISITIIIMIVVIVKCNKVQSNESHYSLELHDTGHGIMKPTYTSYTLKKMLKGWKDRARYTVIIGFVVIIISSILLG